MRRREVRPAIRTAQLFALRAAPPRAVEDDDDDDSDEVPGFDAVLRAAEREVRGDEFIELADFDELDDDDADGAMTAQLLDRCARDVDVGGKRCSEGWLRSTHSRP
eukprot:gene3949-biopygen8315